MGGGSIAPHLFRAGDSRRPAAFNAELAEDAGGGQGEGRGYLLQELADSSQQHQAQKQRSSDRAFPTENDLLDTDPRPGEFAQQIEPEPKRQGYGWNR